MVLKNGTVINVGRFVFRNNNTFCHFHMDLLKFVWDDGRVGQEQLFQVAPGSITTVK